MKRQGMDSLCKTSKLACSALRLRQTSEAVNLSHQIKYRRDVCFSQALTSLVTGLMNRLWCTAASASEDDETFLKVGKILKVIDGLQGVLRGQTTRPTRPPKPIPQWTPLP